MSEHAFAQYVRTLGKGRKGARDLERDEAFAAMDMICRYEVEPEQLGAFMMLMRVKEETAAEVAGFVEALRNSIPSVLTKRAVAIDWPSYAGKRRQMPWYLLAALTLSRNGYPVFMHGLHRDDERVYSESMLELLGIEAVHSLSAAAQAIEANGFAYMDIEFLSPLTAELLDTRDLLGLRSPLHTVARMLNPFRAQLSIQPVFHPNYAAIHQQGSALLGDVAAISFKGEGGEAERIPERACKVYGVSHGETWEQEWPGLLPPDKYQPAIFPDSEHFMAVWRGEVSDDYASQAITGTMALVLAGLDRKLSQQQALQQASAMWQSRHQIPSAQRVSA